MEKAKPFTTPSLSQFFGVFLENKIQNISGKNKKFTGSELRTLFGSRLGPGDITRRLLIDG